MCYGREIGTRLGQAKNESHRIDERLLKVRKANQWQYRRSHNTNCAGPKMGLGRSLALFFPLALSPSRALYQ
jgi:hypothetical protein